MVTVWRACVVEETVDHSQFVGNQRSGDNCFHAFASHRNSVDGTCVSCVTTREIVVKFFDGSRIHRVIWRLGKRISTVTSPAAFVATSHVKLSSSGGASGNSPTSPGITSVPGSLPSGIFRPSSENDRERRATPSIPSKETLP